MKKFFALLALVLGVVSCQTESFDVNVGGEQDVNITVSLPEGTRANSALGAFDNIDMTQYDIRYIFQVFNAEGTEYKAKQVICSDNTTVSFPVRLIPNRYYNFVVWADLVKNNETENAHYTIGETLKEIELNAWAPMDETRDAYTGCKKALFDGSAITVELTRPFAKMRVITTDMAELLGVVPSKANVAYTTAHYSSFNALAQKPENKDLNKTHDTFEIVSYGEVGTLFTDYFFATASQEVVKFDMEVIDSNDVSIVTRNFSTDIPVQRNFVTTIKGNILTYGDNITAEIKPNFAGEIVEEVVFVEVSSATEFAAAIENANENTTVVLTNDIYLNDLFTRAAFTGITINGKLNINLNGNTLYGVTTENSGNQEWFLVKGDLTITNGTITTKHEGDDMGWNAMTTIFDVTAGGILNLNGVIAKNLGGSAMAFVAHLNNWGEATLNVTNSTLESNYVAVRVFNSGYDMNNVTIKNSTLKGGSNAFWVHNYETADAYKTLNIDIFNGTNTFEGRVRYGFNAPLYFDENGYSVDENGNVAIVAAAGLKKFATEVNGGNAFAGKTVKLESCIDLNGEEWAPIGTSSNSFKGTFDGQNHTIKNLVVNGGSESNKGLFGATRDGEIKNLIVENAKVAGRLNIGVVAGEPYTTKYTIITVQGHVEVNGMAYVGGVGGKNAYADWTNVTVNADETSYVKAHSIENGKAYRSYVGGICGFNGEGGHKFSNIYSNIDVKGSTIDAGGLFGIAHYGNKFENCVCTGDVELYAAAEKEDAQEIGGIAGVWHNQTGYTVELTNCSFNGTLKTNIEGVEFYYNGLVGAPYSAEGTGKLIIDKKQASLTRVSTADELIAALENNEGVIFANDIKIEPASMSNAYGATGINVKNGQTIDGNGYTLNIKGAGGTWDSGINTTGGLIKNLTVTGSFRGIFINHTSSYSEKVVLKNVTIKDVTYTISCDQGLYQGIEATNCSFLGWTSFAKTAGEAKFVNCFFGEGSGYKYCRPYSNTEFVGCTFCPGYAVDTTRATVTFTDCTWEE